MARLLVLIGYVELMMYLQISGKLDQYINTHYRYLAYLSIILAGFLALVQLLLWSRNEKMQHTHLKTRFQKVSSIVLLSLPILVGAFFPTVSLDATIIQAKGFHFPISEESTGEADIETQYLSPNTSSYYKKSEYDKIMAKIKEKYIHEEELKITDENYLEVMEMMYTFPSEFIGKQISYTGFVYADKGKTQGAVFLFRFGIIHCVADSGVFGLLNELPKNIPVKNNDWLSVKGVIEMSYFKPFNRNLPIVKVSSAKKVTPPENQYVYRRF